MAGRAIGYPVKKIMGSVGRAASRGASTFGKDTLNVLTGKSFKSQGMERGFTKTENGKTIFDKKKALKHYDDLKSAKGEAFARQSFGGTKPSWMYDRGGLGKLGDVAGAGLGASAMDRTVDVNGTLNSNVGASPAPSYNKNIFS